MEEYDYISTLGEGAYGYVWKCQERTTGRLVAIKGFKQAHEEPEIMKLAVREIRVLQTLSHPAVIELIEAFKSKSGRVYMVFPYIGRSTYQELDDYPDGFPATRMKLLVWQLLQALLYLHGKKVVHRDIKPANILLTTAGEAKLCDFGFARYTHCGPRDVQQLSTYVVTRWYRAPEVLLGESYGPASDIWSLGCTVAELATGQPMFPGKSTADQLWRIVRCFGRMSPSQAARIAADPRLVEVRDAGMGRTMRARLPGCDPGLFNVIEACLQPDPRKRPTASELLQMPWFWGVPKQLAGTALQAAYDKVLQAQARASQDQTTSQQHAQGKRQQQPQQQPAATHGSATDSAYASQPRDAGRTAAAASVALASGVVAAGRMPAMPGTPEMAVPEQRPSDSGSNASMLPMYLADLGSPCESDREADDGDWDASEHSQLSSPVMEAARVPSGEEKAVVGRPASLARRPGWKKEEGKGGEARGKPQQDTGEQASGTTAVDPRYVTAAAAVVGGAPGGATRGPIGPAAVPSAAAGTIGTPGDSAVERGSRPSGPQASGGGRESSGPAALGAQAGSAPGVSPQETGHRDGTPPPPLCPISRDAAGGTVQEQHQQPHQQPSLQADVAALLLASPPRQMQSIGARAMPRRSHSRSESQVNLSLAAFEKEPDEDANPNPHPNLHAPTGRAPLVDKLVHGRQGAPTAGAWVVSPDHKEDQDEDRAPAVPTPTLTEWAPPGTFLSKSGVGICADTKPAAVAADAAGAPTPPSAAPKGYKSAVPGAATRPNASGAWHDSSSSSTIDQRVRPSRGSSPRGDAATGTSGIVMAAAPASGHMSVGLDGKPSSTSQTVRISIARGPGRTLPTPPPLLTAPPVSAAQQQQPQQLQERCSFIRSQISSPPGCFASGSVAWLPDPSTTSLAGGGLADRTPSYLLTSFGGCSTALGTIHSGQLAYCDTVFFDDCAGQPSAAVARLRAGLPAPNPRAPAEPDGDFDGVPGGSSYPNSAFIVLATANGSTSGPEAAVDGANPSPRWGSVTLDSPAGASDGLAGGRFGKRAMLPNSESIMYQTRANRLAAASAAASTHGGRASTGTTAGVMKSALSTGDCDAVRHTGGGTPTPHHPVSHVSNAIRALQSGGRSSSLPRQAMHGAPPVALSSDLTQMPSAAPRLPLMVAGSARSSQSAGLTRTSSLGSPGTGGGAIPLPAVACTREACQISAVQQARGAADKRMVPLPEVDGSSEDDDGLCDEPAARGGGPGRPGSSQVTPSANLWMARAGGSGDSGPLKERPPGSRSSGGADGSITEPGYVCEGLTKTWSFPRSASTAAAAGGRSGLLHSGGSRVAPVPGMTQRSRSRFSFAKDALQVSFSGSSGVVATAPTPFAVSDSTVQRPGVWAVSSTSLGRLPLSPDVTSSAVAAVGDGRGDSLGLAQARMNVWERSGTTQDASLSGSLPDGMGHSSNGSLEGAGHKKRGALGKILRAVKRAFATEPSRGR